MQTRIREFRKLRGMTLKELADKIKTTPQTVQRLETANMTVSMDWLEKIARALLIEPADLIAPRSGREIKIVGNITGDGRVHKSAEDKPALLHLEVPADNPIAARLDARNGPYEAGVTIVANILRPADMLSAHGYDCLVAVSNGSTLLRRVIRGNDNNWTIISLENGGEVQYDLDLDWAAPIIMSVKILSKQ